MKTPGQWRAIREYGKPGSAKRLAHEWRSAMCPVTFHGITLDNNRPQVLEQFTNALRDYDHQLFSRVASGLKDLAQTEEQKTEADLSLCVYKAYTFLKGLKTVPSEINKGVVCWLGKRIYGYWKATGSEPQLPLPKCSPQMEKKIARRIENLPGPKMSRIYSRVGISHLPQSKRGKNSVQMDTQWWIIVHQ
jgi:hypothetical protein